MSHNLYFWVIGQICFVIDSSATTMCIYVCLYFDSDRACRETEIQIRHGSITSWQSHLLTWFLHTLVSWLSWRAVWCVTLRDISPPPLMGEWKGYDNALMEYGHNKTNNMCCYVMIRGFLIFAGQQCSFLSGLKSNFNMYLFTTCI